MAKHYLLKCKECDDINEIACDCDNPMFCPSCRSVDCFEELEEEVDLKLINGGNSETK